MVFSAHSSLASGSIFIHNEAWSTYVLAFVCSIMFYALMWLLLDFFFVMAQWKVYLNRKSR